MNCWLVRHDLIRPLFEFVGEAPKVARHREQPIGSGLLHDVVIKNAAVEMIEMISRYHCEAV